MEHWKAIAGYDGLYEVSDMGRVRSLKYGKDRILKPFNNTCGYLRVYLCKDGQRKMLLVHRIVADTFISKPQGLDTVNHKDEDKTNNTVSNLEWMSRADNIRYSANKSVQMLDKKTGELLATFPSTNEAGRVTGITQQHISSCCNGKRKSAGGYVWRYI